VSARTFAVVIGILALLGLLGYGLLAEGEGTLAVGDPIPETELPVLGGADGETGSVADQRGKWVLVNVWASWCVPCRDEAPDIQRFYERHGGQNLEIVGIDTQETAGDGLDFVDEFGLTYPQLHDGPGEFADELKTTGVPENFLVDPEGKIALIQPGPVSEQLLENEVAPRIEGDPR
jgi:cytochrome c biogenesis protein CcmG/thiol:disulfide interchange protein DsbE